MKSSNEVAIGETFKNPITGVSYIRLSGDNRINAENLATGEKVIYMNHQPVDSVAMDCTKIHAEHKVGLDLSLLPEGWVDTSYQHDMCASYSKGDLMIYVSTEFSDKPECSIWNDATQEEFGNSLTWEEATSLVKAPANP